MFPKLVVKTKEAGVGQPRAASGTRTQREVDAGVCTIKNLQPVFPKQGWVETIEAGPVLYNKKSKVVKVLIYF